MVEGLWVLLGMVAILCFMSTYNMVKEKFDDKVHKAYTLGFFDGKAEGHNEGVDEGYKEGYDTGHTDGENTISEKEKTILQKQIEFEEKKVKALDNLLSYSGEPNQFEE